MCHPSVPFAHPADALRHSGRHGKTGVTRLPFVEPSETNNVWAEAVGAMGSRNGPVAWREGLAVSKNQRILLIRWLPGTVNPLFEHHQPADLFLVLQGSAELIGSDEPLEVPK